MKSLALLIRALLLHGPRLLLWLLVVGLWGWADERDDYECIE